MTNPMSGVRPPTNGRSPVDEAFSVQGDFRQFVSNKTVTVKIITVEPGHRLSPAA